MYKTIVIMTFFAIGGCARPDDLGSRTQAVGAPVLFSEFPVDVNTPPAGRNRRFAAAGFGDGSFLVAYFDYALASGGQSRFYSTRIALDGTVLDLDGVALSPLVATDSSALWFPAIAASGSSRLVVFPDNRNSGRDLYANRVQQDGSVLDSTNIVVSEAQGSQFSVAVASDGTDYLAVWWDSRAVPTQIYGARIQADGTVLDTDGVRIGTSTAAQYAPAVAFAGGNYFVVWDEMRGADVDIFGARVALDGTVLDSAGLPITTAADDQALPAIASDGTGFLVVWEDSRNHGADALEIYGARVQADGTVLDTAGFAILETSTSWASYPDVTFDGASYLVVWDHWTDNDGLTVQGTWVEPDGTVAQSAPMQISQAGGDDEGYPAVTSDGKGMSLVVYDQGDDWQRSRVRARMVYRSGIGVDAGVVADAGTDADVGAVADAGVPADAGADTDAAPPSEAGVDGATSVDLAPTPDASPVDASSQDAPPPFRDAGDLIDSGTPKQSDGGGCDCALGRGGAISDSATPLLLGLALLWARRRRRR